MRSQHLKWILNLLSVASLCVLVWELTPRHLSRPPDEPPPLRVGSRLRLSGVSWNAFPRTLVFALSTHCLACKRDAEFHRYLVGAAGAKSLRVVALFQEPAGVPQFLLSTLGVESVREARIVADFATIGIAATPTLLLVDRDGIVQAEWTGRLGEGQEKDVVAKLELIDGYSHLEQPIGSDDALAHADEDDSAMWVPASELALLATRRSSVLVDSRDRQAFAKAHISGALNIPLDELASRAWHELPMEEPVVIYCADTKICASAPRAPSQTGLCKVTHYALSYLGYRRVRYVADDLNELAGKGVPVLRIAEQAGGLDQ